MPHDYFWQWRLWVFPMFMPIFWIVIFGRRGAKKPWEPGRSPEGETALDIVYT